MRGEKRTLRALRKENKGSPPLARGKGNDTILYIGIDRITPACAGKSYEIDNDEIVVEDHPRLRGEKTLYLI